MGNVTFANEEIYHVYNRGVEKRTIFMNVHDYERAIDTFMYYRFSSIPKKYSDFIRLPAKEKILYINTIYAKLPQQVEIIAYCLMPNHFHLLIKQKVETGITRYISNSTNSYTKYFNTKNKRVGPLFQGNFKAVHIETTEQLLHVSRYIHLNPITSSMLSKDALEAYPWSSYSAYLHALKNTMVTPTPVMENFISVLDYKFFVKDHIGYAQQLEKIKHLVLE